MSGHPSTQAPVTSSGVRRVHTISASSRAAYNDKAPISEEADDQQLGYGDEVVDQDWVGGAGIVGEKSSGLHRQSSLPTSYHRGTS
jgi:YTH domain-containing family protein